MLIAAHPLARIYRAAGSLPIVPYEPPARIVFGWEITPQWEAPGGWSGGLERYADYANG
jgi:hypothetical protein